MKCGIAVLTVFILTYLDASGQVPEDALRLGQSGYGVSARSMSMGNAMTGLAQGFDAAFYNPAGLAQSRQSEVTGGLNFLGYNNDASYYGTGQNASSSQTDLSDLGVVYPFPTTRGSFVIALGYNRFNDFNTALGTNGYNPNSSIIPTLFNSDANYDVPFQVGLDDEVLDTSTNPATIYITRMLIQKNVQQSGIKYESGGMNNWSASAAGDIAENFSVGLTLNLISGSYNFTQTFTETDPKGLYSVDTLSTRPGAVGFESFAYNLRDNQDISGWNAKAGFLYRFVDGSGDVIGRFGLSITFPSFVTVTDNFSDAASATFLTGTVYSYPAPSVNTNSSNNYDITTPFKFSIGGSGGNNQLTLSAEIEYTDWTQLEFSNSNLPGDFISGLNDSIKANYRQTVNLHGGVEVALTDPRYSPFVPFIRAGFSYLPSPYKGDGEQQAQKLASGGIGFRIQNSVDLDLAYQYGWWNYDHHQLYDASSIPSEKITSTNFMFTFKYNF
ncbi:MAG TPA: hypothetical protein VLX91_03260 [Candidatus Acidoferrales bacterium]|nr:hypothetical protein [Candidatus Acidoferrales bacterium]